MHEFKITNKMNVVCRYEKTRNGFRHLAELFINGAWIMSDKACYTNRTWERFEFETVLVNILQKAKKGGHITDKKLSKYLSTLR